MGSRMRLLGLAALFALVTACGGGGEADDGVASLDEPAAEKDAGEEKLSDEDQMLKYTECLRENGVEVEDAPAGGGGAVALPAMPLDDVEGNEAFEKCEEHLPNGGEPEELSAEDLDAMRKQAKCLRDHGLDVPDPTAENPMMEFNDTGDPEAMEKAMEACGMGISVEGAPAEGEK
jgi:hypothetical protein